MSLLELIGKIPRANRIRLYVSRIMYLFGVAGNSVVKCRNGLDMFVSRAVWSVSCRNGVAYLPRAARPSRSLRHRLQRCKGTYSRHCLGLFLGLLDNLVVGHHDLLPEELQGNLIAMYCLQIRCSQRIKLTVSVYLSRLRNVWKITV